MIEQRKPQVDCGKIKRMVESSSRRLVEDFLLCFTVGSFALTDATFCYFVKMLMIKD